MKRIQHTFVVESKFPRKATRISTNSIWGDTDLKAIARQVEDLLPGSRKSETDRQSTGTGRILFDVPVTAVDLVAHETPFLDSTPKQDPEVPELLLVASSTTSNSPSIEPRVDNEPQAEKLSELPTRKVVEVALRSSDNIDIEFVDFDEISMEQLSALENENRKLLREFAERLKANNERIEAAISEIDRELIQLLGASA